MRLHADIHRRIDNFELNVRIQSDVSRIGILGTSGSGKSMTLRSIAGIEDVDHGYIESNGRTLFDSSKRINLKPQKRNVGYMFQNYALFPTMTVMKNVMAGLRGSREENMARASEILRRFRMEGYEERLPAELSGGQQQRVALARILVTEPELILLDEPFSALDEYLRDRMQAEMLEMLEDYPGQVIMVSHNRDELFRFSEELFVVFQGRILRSGETEAVFRDPGTVEAARLMGCKNISNATRRDAHTVEASGWGITLRLSESIPEWVRHLGYRAHSFEPVWGERQENCIRFDLARTDELPFERKYYIRPEIRPEAENIGSMEAHDEDALICWFAQGEMKKIIDEKGVPDYLKMTEENILLLE